MFIRQSDEGAKLSFDLIYTSVIQLIIYLIQQSIMNDNQTAVDSTCLEYQQSYTSWISFYDTILLIGIITSVILLAALCCGSGPLLALAVAAKALYYIVSSLLFLALFIWSQFILFSQKASTCSNDIVAVDRLRNVPFFWAIVTYVGFGCGCLLCCVAIVARR